MDNRHLETAHAFTDELINYMRLIATKRENSESVMELALVANIAATDKTNALLMHIIELLTHPEEE